MFRELASGAKSDRSQLRRALDQEAAVDVFEGDAAGQINGDHLKTLAANQASQSWLNESKKRWMSASSIQFTFVLLIPTTSDSWPRSFASLPAATSSLLLLTTSTSS